MEIFISLGFGDREFSEVDYSLVVTVQIWPVFIEEFLGRLFTYLRRMKTDIGAQYEA